MPTTTTTTTTTIRPPRTTTTTRWMDDRLYRARQARLLARVSAARSAR